jgi:hypothetical protein
MFGFMTLETSKINECFHLAPELPQIRKAALLTLHHVCDAP